MAQFSVKIMRLTGSVLGENQHWHPFDYFTCGITLPMPGAPQIVMTRRVTSAPGGGTVLSMYTARPAPEDDAFFEKAATGFDAALRPAIERLRAVLAE